MFLLNKKNYKILQIVPNFDMGGVEQGTLDLACHLQNTGYQSFIATAGGDKIVAAQAQGVTVFKMPVASKNPYILLKNIHNLKKICKEFRINLMHVRSRAPAFSAIMAARSINIPLVTTFHGVYNFTNAAKKYYNSVMVRGNRVIAVSNYIKNHILTHYDKWICSEKIRLIHRGIDIDYFNPNRIDKDIVLTLKKAWNLPSDQPIFLMPGRLTRWKGQASIIRMLAKLPTGIVIFLGSDQGRQGYIDDLKALALSLNVERRVRFVDNCSYMREAYSLATGVLHASTDPEAFGRVIAEAQAMGKPIMVSTHGAGREIILDKSTGWLADPNSIPDMEQAVLSMLNLTSAGTLMLAHQARQRIINHFSLDDMMDKTLQVYDELLGA